MYIFLLYYILMIQTHFKDHDFHSKLSVASSMFYDYEGKNAF